VNFFTTKLFKLSLSLCAPASDDFQLTIVVITRWKARQWWGKSSGSVGGLHFLQRGVGWGQRADNGHTDDALAFHQCRIGENLLSDDDS